MQNSKKLRNYFVKAATAFAKREKVLKTGATGTSININNININNINE